MTVSPQLNLLEFHAASRIPAGVSPSAIGILPDVNGVSSPVGYSPADLETAYGFDNIHFGSIVGDGTGQTIALVDAYDDPDFVDTSDTADYPISDLAQFDQTLGIPDPPSFTKVNQSGQTSPLPGVDPAGAGNPDGNWEIEEALDIEYAHGLAPGANIVLVEATTDSNADLFAAIKTAASLPGVSVVSMSWGFNEYAGEQALDSVFVTPTGHQGVTFVAASGDEGGYSVDDSGNPTTTPGVLYPAASPNVLGVGGTSLNLNSDSSYDSETAWSGSGGGTSLYEPEPTFQEAVQTTGYRTVPDVAFDADPNTGVAVYDSYNNTDNSGPWVEVGGTSLAAPSWAALIAIANQGRVLAGASTLDGPSETLPALYAVSANDFNDITSGSNGVFSAGPGYDEVTGLGSPKASLLIPDLATYGTASQVAVTAQPPSSVIAGDTFGVVAAAESPNGDVDPAFDGTMTISLASGPAGATLSGTLTATAYHGVAVFDGLSLSQLGNGYTLQISSSFPTIATEPFDVIANPTPWQGTFYPVPTDASLRAAINQADSDSFAFNTILLSASSYLLSNTTAGEIVINNPSSLPGKTLTITGQGQASTIIGSVFNWQDRIFEIEGAVGKAVDVVFQNLTIEGGNADNGGALGGNAALGGGLLIEDATVTITDVTLEKNKAQGAYGASGATVGPGLQGNTGVPGRNARGGAIYLASGTLSLLDETILQDQARGGMGGQGGQGGGQGTKAAVAVTGGQGGSGGDGGSAAGGGIYAATGNVILGNDVFDSNEAIGGPGGSGGAGGSGGKGSGGTKPGLPGGPGGAGGPGGMASGGAIYLAAGTLTLTTSSLTANSAIGGAGGVGGAGGPGTNAVGSITGIFGGSGSILSSIGALAAKGGPGGDGGPAGAAADGAGGGIMVAGGSLTVFNTTLSENQAVGGQGGVGGRGGTGGFALGTKSSLSGFGLGVIGQPAGDGASGGQGGAGYGGGIDITAGTVVVTADTLSGNSAQGGQGGTGGHGGSGPLAALGSSLGLGTSGVGGGTGTSLGTGQGGGGGAGLSAGAGSNGGNGGTGAGGGLYISGGTLTLTNATIAANSAVAGALGTGGDGGKAGSGTLTGGKGDPGSTGGSYGGGLYVNGAVVDLFNSTVALNVQTGSGTGGGVAQVAGTVTAVSTLFGGNGAADYSGDVNATDSLFQTAPTGTLSGTGNLVRIDPLLDPNGLQNNGGPTETIALQASSPALGAGTNPEHLFTDQRGYAPRTGPDGTDIGAYQLDAEADTQAPTATLQAVAVTRANAGSLNPYTFSIKFTDNVAIAAASSPGAVVKVIPAGANAPITATIVSTTPIGNKDAPGDAPSFLVTYEIAPPGGSWTAGDDGLYTVALGGSQVTDLAGNPVAAGSLGTFSVQIANNAPTVTVGSTLPDSTYGQSVSFTVDVTGTGPTPTGTVQFLIDGRNFGSPIGLSGGAATSPSTTVLGAGNQTIEADYSGDSNYASGEGNYTQVVNQAPLNIVPNNLSRAAGQRNPTLTYQFSGFVNGDTATSADITGSAVLTTTATTSSPAGSYPITVTGAGTSTAANYRFPAADFGSGTLTVSSNAASVVVGSTLSDSTYGQSVSFTVEVTGAGPTPTGTVQFLIDGTDFGSPIGLSGGAATSPSTTGLGAGNQTIEADYSGDSNYASGEGSYTQVVNQAPLNIVPNNLSRAAGQRNPTLTYQLTGFVNGDTAASVDVMGAAVLTTTATASSPVGTYPITVTSAGTLEAANYDFPTADFETGTLTVTRGVVGMVLSSTSSASTYGQAVSFTVHVSGDGMMPEGAVQFVVDGVDFGSPVTLSGGVATSVSTTALGAGSHSIQADYLGDSSYAATASGYTQVVNKASLTLVVNSESVVRFGSVPALRYSFSGFVNGDVAATSALNLSLDPNPPMTSSSPAGYYSIESQVNSFSSPNYILGGTQPGILTIVPAVTEVLVDLGHKSEPLSALTRKQKSAKITAIDVIFSDNVDVSVSMLRLLGVTASKSSFRTFGYNSANLEATWKLRTPIAAGQLNFSVSGEAALPVAGTGPPIGAAPFSAAFSAAAAKSRKSAALRARIRAARAVASV
jgi:hypothetical protein